MRNALGTATNSAPIIWNSDASISILLDPEDFQGTMQSSGTITQLKGIARELQIKGSRRSNLGSPRHEGQLANDYGTRLLRSRHQSSAPLDHKSLADLPR
jgi:hypothetical protein